MGSGIPSVDSTTCLPYALVVAAVALIAGYLPAALGLPNWAAILGGIVVLGGLFLLLPGGDPRSE